MGWNMSVVEEDGLTRVKRSTGSLWGAVFMYGCPKGCGANRNKHAKCDRCRWLYMSRHDHKRFNSRPIRVGGLWVIYPLIPDTTQQA